MAQFCSRTPVVNRSGSKTLGEDGKVGYHPIWSFQKILLFPRRKMIQENDSKKYIHRVKRTHDNSKSNNVLYIYIISCSMTGNPVCIQINLSDNTHITAFLSLFQAVQMWEPEIPCLLFWAQTFLSWSRRQWKVLTPLPQPSSPQYLTLGLPPRGLLQHSMQALWCNNYVQLEGRMKFHLMEHRIDRQMRGTFQHHHNTCNHHAIATCFVYRI